MQVARLAAIKTGISQAAAEGECLGQTRTAVATNDSQFKASSEYENSMERPEKKPRTLPSVAKQESKVPLSSPSQYQVNVFPIFCICRGTEVWRIL